MNLVIAGTISIVAWCMFRRRQWALALSKVRDAEIGIKRESSSLVSSHSLDRQYTRVY